MKLNSSIKSLLIIVFFSSVFSSVLLKAQVVPGRWEKVDALPTGSKIILTLKAGDRIVCTFKSSSVEELTVLRDSGEEIKIPKAEIQQAVREEYQESPVNRTLLGAAIGAGAGA